MSLQCRVTISAERLEVPARPFEEPRRSASVMSFHAPAALRGSPRRSVRRRTTLLKEVPRVLLPIREGGVGLVRPRGRLDYVLGSYV